MSSEYVINLLRNNQKLLDELINTDYFEQSERLKKVGIEPEKIKQYLRALKDDDVVSPDQGLDGNTNEAIVAPALAKLGLRPALRITGNDFTDPKTDFWKIRLAPHRENIKKAISSVGRVEVENHPQGFKYVGTGWLVAEDIIVTNRHVAETFAFQEAGKFTFDKNLNEGKKIKVNIDFLETFDNEEEEFDITEVLYIEPRSGSDIAFLKVKRNDDKFRAIMPLANTIPPAKSEIVVIGYPARDSQRNPVEPAITLEIFEDIYDKKRLQPGQILSLSGLQNSVPTFTHDCSTLGGNSGSIVFDYKTGQAIGLHFGGVFEQENYAVPSTIIAQRLKDLQSKKLIVLTESPDSVEGFPNLVEEETIDNETPIEYEDTPCFSPLEEEIFEDSILEGVPFPLVNILLPESGNGYYSYAKFREKQFGLSQTINAIKKIGELWFKNHTAGPLIGVGNISKNGGGPVPPHKSHQTGLDVDFRLLRTDGAKVGITFRDPSYSRTRTQELVNTILRNGILRVELILCNDNKLENVQPWPGHDDHLHVRFIK